MQATVHVQKNFADHVLGAVRIGDTSRHEAAKLRTNRRQISSTVASACPAWSFQRTRVDA